MGIKIVRNLIKLHICFSKSGCLWLRDLSTLRFAYSILEFPAVFLASKDSHAFRATKAEACCLACPLTALCGSVEKEGCRNLSHEEPHHFRSANVLVCFKQKLEFIWSGVRKLCAFINAHSCKLKTQFIIPTLGLGGHFSIISLC